MGQKQELPFLLSVAPPTRDHYPGRKIAPSLGNYRRFPGLGPDSGDKLGVFADRVARLKTHTHFSHGSGSGPSEEEHS